MTPIQELAVTQEIFANRGKKPGYVQVVGGVTSQKTHMTYALGDGFEFKIIAFSSEEKAKAAYEEYRFLDENVYYYPAKDLLFFNIDIKGKYLFSQRLEVIQNRIEKAPDATMTILTTVDSFLDGLPTMDEIQKEIIMIDHGACMDAVKLQERLVKIGYERVVQVESPGQFAVRGGIVDIYPLTVEFPIRIEFWGDEIDSIRSFVIENQRSIENLEQVTIYPAAELLQGSRTSFLDYFSWEKTCVFLDEPARLLENLFDVYAEYEASTNHSGIVLSPEDVIGRLNQFFGIAFTALESKLRAFTIQKRYSITARNVSPYHNSFEMLTRDLKRFRREGYRVVLVSASKSRAKRLAEDFRDYDLRSFYSEDRKREVRSGEILVTYGHVTRGYEYPMLKFIVIAESDIFGKRRKKKKRRTYSGEKIQDFANLKVGDYVVHENHGLGIYQGIEQIEVDKVTKDYMKISYAAEGVLYILATQLDLIQKYAGSDAKKPKLNKLGTAGWIKTKSQVKASVHQIAKDLVDLYAHRQDATGYAYEPDTVWQKEFEEMFPFVETDDQLDAIADTKRDMESKKIMDRLICGDVGYGKTEIAIRAAFKAVQENKQVAYLVPTTILAQQHYNTFMQRMRDFPVRIDLLCRFRTGAQIRKSLEDMEKGLVDIVIGTHRILSKDVKYKDLGLLVIDEEQRFGVRHKEKIKKLKENVDVLTMTATPIPRTLHMSLIGIRDLSVLDEAPMDRMPIQTYVMEYQEEMVRDAIERELKRNGQIYYVYNRVSDIADVAGKIQKLVPDAVVSYVHGQMGERHLENIMYDFINGEIDVLVSTTIVETGLDISNANTMIVHDADRFGLSQLYQLRGRIGRSNRMAYAFLLYRRDKLLKEVAEKRLSAIREFTDLGSGIKIAMRDLEIRGAGNLLGEAQSGHMAAVGYDLYCKMLNQAVRELKGEVERDVFTTTIELHMDAFIPAGYIANAYQKLDIYKRIATIANDEEMDDMLEELLDRFGDIPKKAYLLLRVAAIKALANTVYVTAVEQQGDVYKFVMYEKAKVDPGKIPDVLELQKGNLEFKNDTPPYFLYRQPGKKGKLKEDEVLDLVKGILEDFKKFLLV